MEGHVAAPAMIQPGCTTATATIVIADDDAVSRVATAGRLKRLGHQVHEAEDGQAGLALITELQPDLAILDWMMPKLDGPAVCEAVRRDPALKSCYLILLTALDHPDQLAEGLARGADDFLSKSATPQELLARIRAGLRSSSLVREVEAAHRRLQSELTAASTFVQTLLPRPGLIGQHVRCDWKYVPSLTLGGDLVLAEPYAERAVGLAMIDASGHGVSAALRAAAFSTFLREHWRTKPDEMMVPNVVLEEASRAFPLTDEGCYFTLWLGCWDYQTGRLTWASAGHSGALLVRRNESVEWLATPSLPLGFQPEEPSVPRNTAVGPGDRLVLVSDGLYEAPNQFGYLWGRDRLAETVRAYGHVTLNVFVHQVVAAAQAWMGTERFPDDVAVFACEVADGPAENR